jgi:hypothetical protein
MVRVRVLICLPSVKTAIEEPWTMMDATTMKATIGQTSVIIV